tara:strand:+ start:1754 stop:2500 length:747 start_codon:yes stop_codon:yes gene_type:complete
MTDKKEIKFDFIIPARMESSRFPGKPLKKLSNRFVIDWVYENCSKSKFSDNVFIATDSDLIKKHCIKTNKKYILTGTHNCASNRVAEASRKLKSKWIVEVQGDEPLLWDNIIDNWLKKCIKNINNNQIDLFLSVASLASKDADNFNFVKTIINSKGRLQWVSRSRIPSNLKGSFNGEYFRHSGFHLWKQSSLQAFSNIEPSNIEISEDTHATRLVENNYYAQTIVLPSTQAIDNPEDILLAQEILNNQ